MSGYTVGAALDRVLEDPPRPRSITVDHGTEFPSRALENCAYRRGVQLDFIRPGKPSETAFIESFNGRLRDECFERAPLRVDRRRANQDRSLTTGLQSAPRLARPPDAERVRRTASGHDHRRTAPV